MSRDDIPTAAPSEDPGWARLSLQPGDPVGKYIVRQSLGEGGFGAVYQAEQTEPVRRMVALKVIKPGMDTKGVVARFEAERQALALMDHPCVARVFDGGATENGQPFFVMELVKGLPITEHCDRHRLDLGERIRLFIRVCSAVQHAHSKGVIHRDLKPSNILVAYDDDEQTPKVIDFGIAKALSQQLSSSTVFTEQGVMIGTPEYMSPEQAEMGTQDIDTRTDVYALGVVLYELLAGSLPLESRTLRSGGLVEIQRMIREVDPPRPSTRLGSSSDGGDGKEIASKRGMELKSLKGALRLDLDWVIMKCLEKERSRRYETASALAEDLERYLRDEPVLAGPPSASYRIGKFVKRHRLSVGAGAAVACVLVVATIGMTGLALWALRERDRADEQRQIAALVNAFLTEDLLASAAPSVEAGRGRDVPIRVVLEEAARRIETASATRFADAPLVEGAIRLTLGNTFVLLGEYDAAEPHLLRAAALRRAELGADDPGTLEAEYHLAVLYSSQSRFGEALELNGRLAAQAQQRSDLPAALVVSIFSNLGHVHADQREYAAAEAWYKSALESSLRAFGERDERSFDCMGNMAAICQEQLRLDEAERWYLRARAAGEDMGADHPKALSLSVNLAQLYADDGRLEDAERLLGRTIEPMQRVFGGDHPTTLTATSALARLYRQQGRLEDSEPLALQVLQAQRRTLGDDHLSTVGSMFNLGNLYLRLQRADRAIEMYSLALPLAKELFGEDHPASREVARGLAIAYEMGGRDEEALPLRRELLEVQLQLTEDPKADPETLNSAALMLTGPVHTELRDAVRAAELAERACTLARAAGSAELWRYLDTLAIAQHLCGDSARACSTAREALELMPAGADPGLAARLGEYEAAADPDGAAHRVP